MIQLFCLFFFFYIYFVHLCQDVSIRMHTGYSPDISIIEVLFYILYS